jgi:hypothetical protein
MFFQPASKCEGFEECFLIDLRKTPHSPVLMFLDLTFIAALLVPFHHVFENRLT